MAAFIFYTLLMICAGIFIRIFWVPIWFIGSILVIILGVIVSSALTALVFEIFHAFLNNGQWGGFNTYFAYSLVFFTVSISVYMAIVGDMVNLAIDFFRNIFKS